MKNMIKYYTGIGSRQVPKAIYNKIMSIAGILSVKGWSLRSGGAKGCDTAFEIGSILVSKINNDEVYKRHDATPQSKELLKLVIDSLNKEQQTNIIYENISSYVQNLLARSMLQVLGRNLDNPSEFVICYTPNGEKVGGTRYAIQLAEMKNIPIINIGSSTYINKTAEEICGEIKHAN